MATAAAAPLTRRPRPWRSIRTVRQLEPASVTDVALLIPCKTLSLVFLPSAIDSLEHLAAWAKKVPKDSDTIGICSMDVFERFRDAVLAVGRTDDVRSIGAIVTRMTEICEAWLAEQEPEADDAEA